MGKIVKTLKRIIHSSGFEVSRLENLSSLQQPKYRAELDFWKYVLTQYVQWFDGKISSLYGEDSPQQDQKVISYNKQTSAILTWLDVHQKPKYLEDLALNNTAFEGMKILDIGSGPLPSALAYSGCELYCLDPLLPLYIEIGFPVHVYEQRAKFAYGFSEKMPFADDFFDAIISVNAIDHVDDFFATAKEIQRVLRPGGKLRFHIHYHLKTPTEPLELNDQVVAEAFAWAEGFRKLSESKHKRGSVVEDENESYTLWSNF